MASTTTSTSLSMSPKQKSRDLQKVLGLAGGHHKTEVRRSVQQGAFALS